ncbi:hypothetical protein EYF80_015858 [Liparis tanakae]|uniref:Uncharacterized protein n=1 Tax=Liparis tanakae TaxID=230148 RepID=A0A4Z2I7S7_9TELE|nr:hypothetical protein EYF80_015858 [Liparis tanakae]
MALWREKWRFEKWQRRLSAEFQRPWLRPAKDINSEKHFPPGREHNKSKVEAVTFTQWEEKRRSHLSAMLWECEGFVSGDILCPAGEKRSAVTGAFLFFKRRSDPRDPPS